MSDEPTSIVLERLNRLGTAVADMMEAHAQQSRTLVRALDAMEARMARLEDGMTRVERGLHAVASEQVLLGNSVENALSRALRVSIRLDEQEDRPPAQA